MTSTILQQRWFFALLALCLTPSLLLLFGVSLESHSLPLKVWVGQGHESDDVYHVLEGAHHHALLEWTAVMIGLLTVALTLVHFRLSRDLTAPIMGMALFCSAWMDMFHTLAALRVIEASAPNADFIPFTWALSRIFHVLILVVGGLFCLYFAQQRQRKRDWSLYALCAAFALVSYLTIHWAATSSDLPQTQYPGALITRPFDVVPLVVFCLSSGLFWKLYRANPSPLTGALLLTLVPEVILEAHMAFGSSALFDHHFNIAHGLKIIAYLVPFTGLCLEFARAMREEREARNALEQAVNELRTSNAQLEKFAFICSHDLQEPVRNVHSFSEMLNESLAGRIEDRDHELLRFVRDGAARAYGMVRDILQFSRIDQQAEPPAEVPLRAVMDDVAEGLRHYIEERNAVVTVAGELPSVHGVRPLLVQMFMNLVGNGLKFNRSDVPRVTVDARELPAEWQVAVRDNGIGIPEEQHASVFEMFRRGVKRDAYPGTGIGLALCERVAVKHGGHITIELPDGGGTQFIVHFPKLPVELALTA